ncbi:MAG TPA: hypothetical protein VMC09_11375 [Anaerolineales bacterium]|nr:hypothetical protein [Anaerolineales bacterium]
MGALVAIYGNKSTDLVELIDDCQSRISRMIGNAFHPYKIQQVHATITGIGQISSLKSQKPGMNEQDSSQVEIDIDVDGLLHYLLKSGVLPFQVQIGGYQKRNYPFLSRGTSPYERSFSLRDGKALIIGWPIRGKPNTNQNTSFIELVHESKIYPLTLDDIRQAARGFGFLHKYYQNINDFDNDFYFRIGLFDTTAISVEQQEAVENNIRTFLSDSIPVIIEINKHNLFFVFGDQETLPPDSTKTYSVSDPSISKNILGQIHPQTMVKVNHKNTGGHK